MKWYILNEQQASNVNDCICWWGNRPTGKYMAKVGNKYYCCCIETLYSAGVDVDNTPFIVRSDKFGYLNPYYTRSKGWIK